MASFGYIVSPARGGMRNCVREMGGNRWRGGREEEKKEGGEQARGVGEGERKRRTYCLIILYESPRLGKSRKSRLRFVSYRLTWKEAGRTDSAKHHKLSGSKTRSLLP